MRDLGLYVAQVNYRFSVNVWNLDRLVHIEQFRLVAFRHGQGDVLFFLFPNDADRYRAALAAVHGVSKVATVTDGFSVDFHNHVAGPEPSLLGAAAFLHRAHQYSLAVFRAEEVAQLRGKIFHHQSAARGRVNDDD